jgi:hypothetical protein
MKQIEVKLLGLNELGVKELNEYYKHNITKYDNWSPFKYGQTLGITKKRFKQPKAFYNSGLNTYVGNFDCQQLVLNEDGSECKYGGGNFSYQIKHFNHKIYEVEVIETFTEIKL